MNYFFLQSCPPSTSIQCRSLSYIPCTPCSSYCSTRSRSCTPCTRVCSTPCTTPCSRSLTPASRVCISKPCHCRVSRRRQRLVYVSEPTLDQIKNKGQTCNNPNCKGRLKSEKKRKKKKKSKHKKKSKSKNAGAKKVGKTASKSLDKSGRGSEAEKIAADGTKDSKKERITNNGKNSKSKFAGRFSTDSKGKTAGRFSSDSKGNAGGRLTIDSEGKTVIAGGKKKASHGPDYIDSYQNNDPESAIGAELCRESFKQNDQSPAKFVCRCRSQKLSPIRVCRPKVRFVDCSVYANSTQLRPSTAESMNARDKSLECRCGDFSPASSFPDIQIFKVPKMDVQAGTELVNVDETAQTPAYSSNHGYLCSTCGSVKNNIPLTETRMSQLSYQSSTDRYPLTRTICNQWAYNPVGQFTKFQIGTNQYHVEARADQIRSQNFGKNVSVQCCPSASQHISRPVISYDKKPSVIQGRSRSKNTGVQCFRPPKEQGFLDVPDDCTNQQKKIKNKGQVARKISIRKRSIAGEPSKVNPKIMSKSEDKNLQDKTYRENLKNGCTKEKTSLSQCRRSNETPSKLKNKVSFSNENLISTVDYNIDAHADSKTIKPKKTCVKKKCNCKTCPKRKQNNQSKEKDARKSSNRDNPLVDSVPSKRSKDDNDNLKTTKCPCGCGRDVKLICDRKCDIVSVRTRHNQKFCYHLSDFA